MKNEMNYTIRKAKSNTDFERVFDLRFKGYSSYYNCNRDDMEDKYDFSSHCTLLLAEDEQNKPLGTLRILNRSGGKIELDEFIDVENVLAPHESPCAEATRLAVLDHPDKIIIKLLLFKGFFLYCCYNDVITMLVSAHKKVAPDYEFLLFQKIGPKGMYYHPTLGNKKHYSFKLDVLNASNIYRTNNHPLYDFFIFTKHLNISIEDLRYQHV